MWNGKKNGFLVKIKQFSGMLMQLMVIFLPVHLMKLKWGHSIEIWNFSLKVTNTTMKMNGDVKPKVRLKLSIHLLVNTFLSNWNFQNPLFQCLANKRYDIRIEIDFIFIDDNTAICLFCENDNLKIALLNVTIRRCERCCLLIRMLVCLSVDGRNWTNRMDAHRKCAIKFSICLSQLQQITH